MRASRLAAGILAVVSCSASAARADTLGLPVDISGYLRFDKRLIVETEHGKLVHDGVPQFPIYHQAYLQLKAKPSEHMELKLSGVLRFYDFMVAKDLYGLQKTEETFPLEPLLWEAYVDLFGLGTSRLDVRIGKQRIAWGKADKFNPTDNLNPLDLTDFFAFGEHVPSWAIKADLTIVEEKLSLTGVLLAGPTAVSLPRYASLPINTAMTGNLALPEGVSLGKVTVDFKPPPYDGKHMMEALKLHGSLGGVDWSLSYFHGYMDLPLQTNVKIDVASLSPVTLDVLATTELPEEHVLGVDLAGELFTVGWWAEAALTFPNEVRTTYESAFFTRDPDIALSRQPYLKYTLGLDYTMPWGTYLNFQFIQGFFTERSWRQLDHYFLLTLRHKLFKEALTLQAAVMWETDQFRDIAHNYGVVFTPEIGWKPFDGIDLAVGYLGVFAAASPGNTLTLSMYKDDQVYLKVKASY
jgi:hypothetical protein